MKYRYHLGGRSYESAQTRVAAVLLAPTLLALVALYLIPIARVLVLSFTSTNTITNVSTFVGLKNFRYLFGNEVFLKSLGNTFAFTFFKLFAEVAVSLTLAVLLDTRVPMRKFLRISYFAPVVVPVVASSTIWALVLRPKSRAAQPDARLDGPSRFQMDLQRGYRPDEHYHLFRMARGRV